MAKSEAGARGIAQRAVLWAGRKAFGGGSLSDPATVAAILASFGGGETSAGVHVSEETAMRATAVWGCNRILSETIGSLPWAIYEKDRNGNATKVDHELGDVLLGSPNADMTSQEMREAQMVNLGLAGNAYSILEHSSTGRVLSITPYPAQQFCPEQKTDGTIVYKFNDRGRTEELPADKVWHIKGFGGTGLIGFSPIGYARQAVGVALATETFGARFFKDGAAMGGIIKAKEWLKDTQRTATQKTLNEMWQGLVNSHRVQLLEGGMEFQQVVMPLDDAQFLETRKFQIAEICRLYRIPPHMVAELDRSTNNNIEHQGQEFVNALLPYFVRYEQTIAKRLLRPAERSRFFVRFNPEGLLRADSVARSQLYATLLQNGVVSRNEVRAKENLPHSGQQGMDDFTVQSNMTMVAFLQAMAKASQGGA